MGLQIVDLTVRRVLVGPLKFTRRDLLRFS